MLGDSILIIIAIILTVMGIEPMLEESTRKDPVKVIKSVLLVIMGIFLTFYWNTIVP